MRSTAGAPPRSATAQSSVRAQKLEKHNGEDQEGKRRKFLKNLSAEHCFISMKGELAVCVSFGPGHSFPSRGESYDESEENKPHSLSMRNPGSFFRRLPPHRHQPSLGYHKADFVEKSFLTGRDVTMPHRRPTGRQSEQKNIIINSSATDELIAGTGVSPSRRSQDRPNRGTKTLPTNFDRGFETDIPHLTPTYRDPVHSITEPIKRRFSELENRSDPTKHSGKRFRAAFREYKRVCRTSDSEIRNTSAFQCVSNGLLSDIFPTDFAVIASLTGRSC